MKRSSFWLLWFSLIVLSAMGALRCHSVARQVAEAEERLSRYQREAVSLRQQNSQIREELSAGSETDRIVRQAREQFGLVYPEDRVFFADSERSSD